MRKATVFKNDRLESKTKPAICMALLVSNLLLPLSLAAEPVAADAAEMPVESHFQPRYGVSRPLNLWLPPITSLVLPGFDQWWEGQYSYAAPYSFLWLGGNVYAGEQLQLYKNQHPEEDLTTKQNDMTEKDNFLRKAGYGSQLGLFSGGLSAYTSFRTAVTSRRSDPDFDFLRLEKEEGIGDLLLAPFDFRYLGRTSTIVPMAIGALFFALSTGSQPGPDDDVIRSAFGGDDAFFTAGFSFNAGVSEEALFRGYIMPLSHYYIGREWASNAVTSIVFAAAHLNTVQVPVAQLLLGWHLGNVTQNNGWTLGEAIFIHTWWDIFAFATLYQFEKKQDNAAANMVKRPARLWLPAVEWHF